MRDWTGYSDGDLRMVAEVQNQAISDENKFPDPSPLAVEGYQSDIEEANAELARRR